MELTGKRFSKKWLIFRIKQQRRIFHEIYNDIQQKMQAHHCHAKITIIHNPHVMMVLITVCTDRLDEVHKINQAYTNENDKISVINLFDL